MFLLLLLPFANASIFNFNVFIYFFSPFHFIHYSANIIFSRVCWILFQAHTQFSIWKWNSQKCIYLFIMTLRSLFACKWKINRNEEGNPFKKNKRFLRNIQENSVGEIINCTSMILTCYFNHRVHLFISYNGKWITRKQLFLLSVYHVAICDRIMIRGKWNCILYKKKTKNTQMLIHVVLTTHLYFSVS